MITVYDLILINIWMYLYTYFYTLSFPKLVGPEQQTLSLRLSTGNDVFWDDAGVNHLVALTVDGRNLAPLREIESKLYKRNIMQRKTENVHSPGHGWLLNNISVIFILEIPNVYAACIQRTPPPTCHHNHPIIPCHEMTQGSNTDQMRRPLMPCWRVGGPCTTQRWLITGILSDYEQIYQKKRV